VDDEDEQYYEDQEIEADAQGNEEKDSGTTATDSEDEEEEEGHFEQLDADDYKGIVFTQTEVLCNVQEKAGIPPSWILLDSHSTVDVFCNLKILGYI